jgi:hypothetical protein
MAMTGFMVTPANVAERTTQANLAVDTGNLKV